MKGLKPVLAWANAKKMTARGKEICIQRTSAHPLEGGRDFRRRRKRRWETDKWSRGRS